MKKRMIALLIAFTMSITLLAGCGNKDSDSSTSKEQSQDDKSTATSSKSDENGLPIYEKPVTLLLWGAVPPENGPQEVIDNYNELNKHRNIKVEYYRYVNDDNGNVALDTALMAGEKMDLFISYTHARRDARAHSGAVLDITDICKKLDIDIIRDFGSLAQGNIIDGKVYSIPTMKYMDLIYYNKDLLDKKGIEPPKMNSTWEDIREMAKELTDENVYGYFMNYQADFFGNLYSTKNEMKVPYLSEDGKSSMWKKNPDFGKSLETVYEMMYSDKSIMDWGTMIAENVAEGNKQDIMFFNGQIAMTSGGTQVIRNIINKTDFPHDFVTGFAPMPRSDESQEKYYASVEANDHISVNVNCEYPEEAVRFIKWYYTEGYDPMIKNGRLPLYQNYDADHACEIMLGNNADMIDVESFKETVFGKYDNFNLPNTDPNLPAITKIYKEEIESYFLDQTNLKQTLDNLERRSNEILQKSN